MRMKSDNLLRSVAAALIIGVAQMFVLIYFWEWMTLYVQHLPWLLSHGVHGVWLKALLFVFDNSINVALCLPAAFAICSLRPRRLVMYVVVAVLPGFLWDYRLFFMNTTLFQNWSVFLPGALSAAFTLPAALYVSRLLAARRAA